MNQTRITRRFYERGSYRKKEVDRHEKQTCETLSGQSSLILCCSESVQRKKDEKGKEDLEAEVEEATQRLKRRMK